MKFSSRKAVIKAMKDYTIRRGVDYRVHESEPTTFYAKCIQYSTDCDWLIRMSKMSRKYCREIKRYNGSHTCTRATISQDHSNYRKAWLAKQKTVESIFGGWEASYKTLPIRFEAMCHNELSAVVHFGTMPAYQGDDLVDELLGLITVGVEED
ncbi:hypothetical protein Ahy_B08g089548 [Arachis hypogaea]|uniref:Transposase MuDR plant domain-containing protein n=1 Tax=Arachis hypogaea TaxID=3818 RepID=A0A444XY78_ARAHY|nr:hypothetical protein Ahy_B08g089548 [Arachis hypogaea]